MDYVTSPNIADDLHEALNYMEEGTIYSYNAINDPEDFTLKSTRGDEYVIGGISIIRHGNEISLILLAGEKNDLLAKSKELLEEFNKPAEPEPGRENIKPADGSKLEAVPMLSKSNYWKLIVLTRFDFSDMTQNVRYVMYDSGTSYMIITDDISTLGILTPDKEKTVRNMFERIEEYSSLFEICKTFLYIPLYFENHADLIVEEKHPTAFGDNVKKRKWLLKNKLLTTHERIIYRTISVLRKDIGFTPDETIFTAPNIKLDISGYWHRLPIEQIGADKHGRPIHGRTWVEKRLTWIESDISPQDVNVNFHKSTAIKGPNNVMNSGRIYVMRSAAHAKDIFKIGLTKRTSEERSEELSKTSGSPDKFLVVQEWNVSDCILAEKNIHQALSRYRINPTREFFRAPYQEIVSVIDKIISDIETKRN